MKFEYECPETGTTTVYRVELVCPHPDGASEFYVAILSTEKIGTGTTQTIDARKEGPFKEKGFEKRR